MKRIKSFLFYASLFLSILLVGLSFQSAFIMRGNLCYGGELFTIILPIILVIINEYSKDQENKKLKEEVKKWKHLYYENSIKK